MTSDSRHRDMIGALWSLTGAVAAGDAKELAWRSEAAMVAIAAARGGDSFILLHEQDGALHVNGRQLRLAMGVFPAAHGLVQAFRRAGVRELLLDQGLESAGLLDLVRSLVAGDPVGAGAPGSQFQTEGAAGLPADLDLPPVPRASRSAVATGLPSMFLQHQLMAAIPRDWLLSPHASKSVLQAVGDRLLQTSAGLEALELLQRDPERLAAGLRAALLCVVFLRAAGWPAESLAEHGVVALLADLPVPDQGAGPESSAFFWLLRRGSEDLWLRSALVAQAWRTVEADTLHELGLGCDGVAAFVRFAAAVDRAFSRLADASAAVAEAHQQCRLPQEFAEVARLALAGGADAHS